MESRQHTTNSDPFKDAMRKFLGNWNIASPDLVAAKRDIYRPIFESVGAKRFAECVDNVITHYQSEYPPTKTTFLLYMPEPPRPAEKTGHTAEEWRRIRAEQATPEFRRDWTAFMKRLGLKEVPWPDEIGKIMDARRLPEE